MVPSFVRGSIAPIFTIFDAEGKLDDAGQLRFLDYLVNAGGISAFFIRSGMGQMYTFSVDEVKQLASNVLPFMKGKAPVLLGTSGIWDRNYDKRPDPKVFLQQGLELAMFGADLGVDGVVFTMPEAIEPGDGETHADVILRYFETISNAVTVPVFLYQPPGTRPEYCVTTDLIRALADMPAIKAMKISTDNASYISDMTWAVADCEDFAFITGCELAFLAGLVGGAKACIGQGTTLNPKIINTVQNRFVAGDIRGAMDAQRDVNVLCYESKFTTEFFKRYVSEQGHPVGLYSRTDIGGGYGVGNIGLTDDDYMRFKPIYESLLAKYQ